MRESTSLPRSALHKLARFSRVTLEAASPRLTLSLARRKQREQLAGGHDGAPVWTPGFRLREFFSFRQEDGGSPDSEEPATIALPGLSVALRMPRPFAVRSFNSSLELVRQT